MAALLPLTGRGSQGAGPESEPTSIAAKKSIRFVIGAIRRRQAKTTAMRQYLRVTSGRHIPGNPNNSRRINMPGASGHIAGPAHIIYKKRRGQGKNGEP